MVGKASIDIFCGDKQNLMRDFQILNFKWKITNFHRFVGTETQFIPKARVD